MNSNQKKNQMHPQDMRNLLIFCVLSICIYFLYDVFIQKPQLEALQKHRAAQASLAQSSPALTTALTELVETRASALENSPRIYIDNGRIKGSISLKGARLDDIALTEYFTALDKKENVVILSPADTGYPRYIEYGWVSENKNIKLPDADALWTVRGNDTLTQEKPVTIVWDNGAGLVFQRTIKIDGNYMMTVSNAVTNNTAASVKLYPYGLITQKGLPQIQEASWILHEGPLGYIGDSLHEFSYSRLRKESPQTLESTLGWTGITDKYWLMALVPAQGENIKYTYQYAGAPLQKRQKDTGRYQADYTAPALEIAPGATAASESHLFTGAKKVLLLEEYEKTLGIPHLSIAVNFGWFWFFSKPFFYALHFLGEMTGNFGIAIILFTIMIRTAVFPLTNTSYKSFAKMKKVTPQIAELREKHGKDKASLQTELVKLYEKEGVNPLAGCLPILVQIPIFFALYKVLFITIEMRHAPFVGWIHDLSAADPTNLFTLFGLIPWDAPGFLHVGAWPVFMLIAMFIQKQLNPPPQDPIQRDMAWYFPILITYMMSKFASGLVIYWTFSAYIGIIQQSIIMRSLGVPIHIFEKSKAEKKLEEQTKHAEPIAPLTEMVEERVEEALFGDGETSTTVSPPKPKKKKKKK